MLADAEAATARDSGQEDDEAETGISLHLFLAQHMTLSHYAPK